MPYWPLIFAVVFIGAVAAIYIQELSLFSRFFLAKLRKRKAPPLLSSGWLLVRHILALVGIICYLYAYFIEPYSIEVKRLEIKTRDLSRAQFRVVQISDLHCLAKVKNEDRMAEIINSLNPDVIVFTGDIASTPEGLAVFKETARKLKAGIGKYAVTGNIDCWFLRGQDLFGDTGFVNVDGKVLELAKDGDILCLSGLGYRHVDIWRSLFKQIPPESYSIFLYHDSSIIRHLRKINAKVDLYLSGDTHGGQVAFPFYGALITFSKYGKQYESGEYTVDGIKLYVNRGMGMEGVGPFRVRFFSRPEITVFDIVPEK